jgi:hypothetical protein
MAPDYNFIRVMWPTFVQWLSMPSTLEQLREKNQQPMNWNWVNHVEKKAGLPPSPMPDHPGAERRKLTPEQEQS